MATSDPSDDSLMKAYARGDAAAFEQLYARHQAALYRFVRRLLGPSLSAQADEAFQDTWLRVVHARERWEPQGAAFRTWLFTLAHHRVVDLLRRSGREISVDAFDGRGRRAVAARRRAWQHWPAPAGAAPQGEELAFWRRAGERLLHCLDQLPLPQQSAFLLHHDDGLALDEVARALEVGFETAKTRLRYAMSKLQHVHGRLPRADAGRRAMSAPDRDDPRDAWLRQALRHAPDADAAAPTALSDSILAKARAAAAPQQRPRSPAARPSSTILRSGWNALARPPVAAGFASVMAATIVGLMWWDRPMDEALPPPLAPSARTAPAAPPALEQKQSQAPAPAPESVAERAPGSAKQSPSPATSARGAQQDAPSTERSAAPPAARKPEPPAAFPAGEARREVAREPVAEAKKARAPSSFAGPSADAPPADPRPPPAPAPPPDAGRASRPDARRDRRRSRRQGDGPGRSALERTPRRRPRPPRGSATRSIRVRAPPRSSVTAAASATSPLASLLAQVAREPQRWTRRSATGDTAAIDDAWRAWLAEVDAAAAGRWQKAAAGASPGEGARDAAPLQLLFDGRPAATLRLEGRTLRLDHLLGAAPEHWQAMLAADATARLAAGRSRLPP